MSTGKTTTLHEERARATRRKILVEATRLFARQGFHKTTVSDLARAIGMTPSDAIDYADIVAKSSSVLQKTGLPPSQWPRDIETLRLLVELADTE